MQCHEKCDELCRFLHVEYFSHYYYDPTKIWELNAGCCFAGYANVIRWKVRRNNVSNEFFALIFSRRIRNWCWVISIGFSSCYGAYSSVPRPTQPPTTRLSHVHPQRHVWISGRWASRRRRPINGLQWRNTVSKQFCQRAISARMLYLFDIFFHAYFHLISKKWLKKNDFQNNIKLFWKIKVLYLLNDIIRKKLGTWVHQKVAVAFNDEKSKSSCLINVLNVKSR